MRHAAVQLSAALTHTAELPGISCQSATALLCLSAAVVLLAGCETSSTISAGPDPVKCQVSLAAPPMIDAGGGTGTLTVTTNPECSWTATTGAAWISLSPSAGQGSAAVELRAAPNEGSAQRDGDVVVNGQQVRVSQRAPCRFDVAPATHRMAAAGGTGRVTVSTTSDCAWTATSDVTWISLATPNSGSGNGAITFTVQANGGSSERTGNVVVAGQRSTVFQAFEVTPPPPSPPPSPPSPTPPSPTPQPPQPPQPPPPGTSCTFAISSTSQNVAVGGGTGAVAVSTTAGCAWVAASGASWITVTSGSSGTGNGSVAFTVAANSGSARTSTLTIAGLAFTVAQAGCVYTISPTGQNVAVGGGAGTVAVATDAVCAWAAASGASWITVTSGSSGTGNGSTAFTVAGNTGGARTGTLTIAGHVFTVTQAACVFTLSRQGEYLGPNGGSASVDVSTTSTCRWTATSNDSWLLIHSGSSGTGNGQVTYNIAPNAGGARVGSLTVAGQPFRVDQGGQ
jgi:hypothetical protein